jgi:hypothetical protein
MHAQVYDLEGNALLPDFTGGAAWMPTGSQLLVNADGLHVIGAIGEEIARLGDAFADEWAISRDGRRLAYAPHSDGADVTR